MPSKSLPKIIVVAVILSFFGYFYGCQSSLENFSRRYEKITAHYRKVLKNNPKSVKLKLRLAKFYYDFKDYQEVVNLLEGVSVQEARVLSAKSLVKLKEYSRAIEIFQQLKFKPKDCEYLYLYAQTLEEKNLFPKAARVYGKACGSFKEPAKERLAAIKSKTEEGVPPEISKVFKDAESFIGEVKDEAAVLLLVDESIEITPENTSISTVHVIEKILKERGKELAEVIAGYDSTYERIELDFARVITKDKKVIYAAKENVRDVSRYLNFPLYSNSRAFIISMPAVDVGAFIEYKLKIHSSKLVDKDNFNFIYRLREAYPIFKANFNLIIPKAKKANFKFFNQEYAEGFSLKPSISRSKGKKVYSWSLSRIKPIIPEYSMPPASLINPAVLISSFSSWERIYEWWRSLYKDKVKVDKEIKDFTRVIIKGAAADLDKAKKIYEFVAKNIRYVAVEYGDSGHEPHHAGEVFINRYGDCKDQAILLTAMLRSAGLKAYPVLIPTRSAYSIDKNFPSINFNHAICALKNGDEFVFMDPTSETTPFGQVPLSDQGRLVMVFMEDSFRLVTVPGAKDNGIEYDMDIVINGSEDAEITRRVKSLGFFASGYRWYLKYTHPDMIKESIQEKMTEISSSSRLLDYKIENADNFDKDPMLTYKFKADNFLNPAGKLRIVPALDQLYLDYGLISKDERNFPIDFEGLYTKSARIKITLPKNLKVKYLPPSKFLDNPWFSLKVNYRSKRGFIDFSQKLTLKKRFARKKEYGKFKGRLSEALYSLKEEIILQTIKD